MFTFRHTPYCTIFNQHSPTYRTNPSAPPAGKYIRHTREQAPVQFSPRVRPKRPLFVCPYVPYPLNPLLVPPSLAWLTTRTALGNRVSARAVGCIQKRNKRGWGVKNGNTYTHTPCQMILQMTA